MQIETRLVLARLQSPLTKAKAILETLRDVRQAGGTLSKIMGAMSVLNTLVGEDLTSPLQNGDYARHLEDQGYLCVLHPLDGIVQYWLERIEPESIISLGEKQFQRTYRGGVVMVYDSNGWCCLGPYYRDLKGIADLLDPIVWQDGMSIRFDISNIKQRGKQQGENKESSPGPVDRKHFFVPYRVPSSLVGQGLDLESLLGQSVLLVGPSGCGKTTMVHMAAQKLDKRILKINAVDLLNFGISFADESFKILRPDIFLIEDIQEVFESSDRHEKAGLLAWLEHLHGTVTIVGTVMDERESFRDGDLCFPGMRPGRFDHVVVVGLPDEAQRAEILKSYGLDCQDAARQSEGLSPAYLKVLAEARSEWPRCLSMLRLMAPRRER